MKFLPVFVTLLCLATTFVQAHEEAHAKVNLHQIPAPLIDAGLFLGGILEGMNALAQIPDSISCIFDAQGFNASLHQAIADFQQKTPNSISQGITVLSGAVAQAVQDCGNTAEEFGALIKGIYKNVTNVQYDEEGVERLIAGHQQVFEDLASAYGDFTNKSWLLAGDDLGQIFAIFLWGSESLTLTPPRSVNAANGDIGVLVQILSGFYNGIGLKNDLEDLTLCENYISDLEVDCKTALELFKNGTTSDIQQGIIALGNIVGDLINVNVSCQAVGEELNQYFENIRSEFQNETTVELALEDFLENFQTTVTDFKNIENAFENKQWYDFGQALGTVVTQFQTYLKGNTKKGFLPY